MRTLWLKTGIIPLHSFVLFHFLIPILWLFSGLYLFHFLSLSMNAGFSYSVYVSFSLFSFFLQDYPIFFFSFSSISFVSSNFFHRSHFSHMNMFWSHMWIIIIYLQPNQIFRDFTAFKTQIWKKSMESMEFQKNGKHIIVDACA